MEASQRSKRLAIVDRTSDRQHGGTEGAVHELPTGYTEAAGLSGHESALGPAEASQRSERLAIMQTARLVVSMAALRVPSMSSPLEAAGLSGGYTCSQRTRGVASAWQLQTARLVASTWQYRSRCRA